CVLGGSRLHLHSPSLTKWSTLSSLPVASFPVDCLMFRLKSIEAHGHTRFLSRKFLIFMWMRPSDITLHSPSLTKWSTLSSLPVASFPADCQSLRLKSLEAPGHTRFLSKKRLICTWMWPSDITLHSPA